MRNDIGPICCFKKCMVVSALPKTRSGKILRCILKGIVRNKPYKVPPTILNPDILPTIKEIVIKNGLGKDSSLKFDEYAK